MHNTPQFTGRGCWRRRLGNPMHLTVGWIENQGLNSGWCNCGGGSKQQSPGAPMAQKTS